MKAVILAGGSATGGSGEHAPGQTPMVEIGGRPVLWHILKQYAQHGVNDFVVCCGDEGYALKEFFQNYFLHMSDVTFDLPANQMTVHRSVAEPWRVTLADRGRGMETGGRLLGVREYLEPGEPFYMTYGDAVADVDLTALLQFHRQHAKAVTVTSVQPAARLGAVGARDPKRYSFEGRPEGEEEGGWMNGGFFVLEPSALDAVREEGEVFEREPMEALAKRDEVRAFLHRGFSRATDTVRGRRCLEDLWQRGKAPWKTW